MKNFKLSSIEEKLLLTILERSKINSQLLKSINLPSESGVSDKQYHQAMKQQLKICDHFIKKITGDGKRDLHIE